jgi:hypothetical protein
MIKVNSGHFLTLFLGIIITHQDFIQFLQFPQLNQNFYIICVF